MGKYNFESNSGDYLTPETIYAPLLKEIGRNEFDCDVCCSADNIPAIARFKLDGFYIYGNKVGEVDGLRGGWSPINWLNPPFKECAKWVKKASQEQLKGNTTYAILPVRTETAYWAKYILDEKGGTNRPDVEVRFLRKGLKFLAPDGKEMDVFKNPLAIVIFKGKQKGDDKKCHQEDI